jgi:predicted acyl esterase
MVIEWDVPIDMDDGLQLRADIFRPIGQGPCPVLLSAASAVQPRSAAAATTPTKSPQP